MEARELRIGNLCKEITHSNNGVVKVEKRHYEDIENGEIDLFPIPLTEEWLVKFGFEEDDSLLDPLDTPNGNFWVEYNKEFVCIHLPFFEFMYADGSGVIEIKHVHQLQNLYSALTGEELDYSI